MPPLAAVSLCERFLDGRHIVLELLLECEALLDVLAGIEHRGVVSAQTGAYGLSLIHI